ncbi:uncharacterized protein LOC134851431 isoform X2 [Symsagittifera roscoffensis]|uniref:uncharacterized protein LOC134851431 isoform X2 n=1 Tax=Symsagittifera roscoffensis TaxID=84072 RepID=UPI00307C0B7D
MSTQFALFAVLLSVFASLYVHANILDGGHPRMMDLADSPDAKRLWDYQGKRSEENDEQKRLWDYQRKRSDDSEEKRLWDYQAKRSGEESKRLWDYQHKRGGDSVLAEDLGEQKRLWDYRFKPKKTVASSDFA